VKVYDCFLFFNELDLLEIRLEEHYNQVDKFVLVECSETFSKKKKPLFFKENIKRYERFLDKIIHVVVEDTPDFPPRQGRMGTYHSRHDVEWFQRDCISRGLSNCEKDDIVIVSDVDEIIRSDSFSKIRRHFETNSDFIAVNHRFFYYYLNGLCVQNGVESPWWGAVACKYSSFPGAENMRKKKGSTDRKIQSGGWHFSYLGGAEAIARKIESIAHAEWDNDHYKSINRIQDRISKGADLFDRADKPQQVYIEIDSSFPEFVVKNQKRFGHLIKEK